MATTSSMFMYSLTIQPPSSITQAILGQFAGTKEQQIVTASGSRLTIHRPDPQQARVTTVLSQDFFGIIRTLAAFRLAGSNKGMTLMWALKTAFSDSRSLRSSSIYTSTAAVRLEAAAAAREQYFSRGMLRSWCRLHYHRVRLRPHYHHRVCPVQEPIQPIAPRNVW